MNHLQIEGKRGVRDFPSTVREAEEAAVKTQMPLVHNNELFEPIGMTLARKMGEGVPDSLPSEFLDQLAVTACDPYQAKTLGRIIYHCLSATQEGEVSSV